MNIYITLLMTSLNSMNLAMAAGPSQVDKGKALFAKGDYQAAAIEFFKDNNPQNLLMSRYGFGISLNRLKFPHLASVPLMTAATQASGKLQKKALDTLVKISYDTNNNALLNYSINKLAVEDLEETSKEVYNNRLAEYHYENDRFDEALANIDLVLKQNPDNEKSLMLGGLIYLRKNQPDKAVEFFKYLATFWEKKSPNNELRGVALANLGRAYYQAKKFKEAEAVYRQIPKDHSIYRKVQMELAWTLFRAGKIRSSLSALQTLHTPYYENFYMPESFILRSIILIFACQGEEAVKSIKAFNKNYKGLDTTLTTWLERKPDVSTVIKEIQTSQQMMKTTDSEKKGSLPFFVVRTLMDEHPLNGLLKTKREILKEQILFQKNFKPESNRKMAAYTKKAYAALIRNIDKNIARVFNHKVALFQKDYQDFDAQVEFLKYEALEEMKRATKSKLKEPQKIGENERRSFFVQNGYRYWPFTGEYWVDEIGNYQYLGVNRCEN